MARNFEIAIEGSAIARYFPRFRKWHSTREEADAELDRVYGKLNEENLPTACHRYEIYDKAGRLVGHS